MTTKKIVLQDAAAERAILSSFIQHGNDAYYAVSDIIDISCFVDQNNQFIYKCLTNILDSGKTVDVPTILSSANDIGILEQINTTEQLTFIRGLFNLPVNKENIRKHAVKIKKLQIGRLSQDKHKEAHATLSRIDGSETIDEILSISEKPLLELSFSLNGQQEDRPLQIAEGGRELLEQLITNPVTNIGIPTPFPRYNKVIGGGLRNGGVNLVAARPKAQPLDSKILTPSGWVRMGDIKIGDEICHPNGSISIVEKIHKFGKQKVYKFTFDDNSHTFACGEHFWKVKQLREKTYSKLTYNQMKKLPLKKEGQLRWQFPLLNEVCFKEKEVDIDPYLLGVLIGDGSIIDSVKYSSADQFIIDKVGNIIDTHYEQNKICEDKYDYRISKKQKSSKPSIYVEALRKYGLFGTNSHTKFIPKEFLFNSKEIRLQLLRGLMDTDGSISKNRRLEYTTVSKKLKDDFIFLVNSLGGKAKSKLRTTTCNGKAFKSFRIGVSFNDNREIFSLPRKVERCTKRVKSELKRRLLKCRSIGYKEVQCITVSNEDGLYITDNCIVTSNCGKTTFGKEVAIHVGGKLKIPTLFLDTEMVKDDQYFRSLASISRVPINRIETGQFGQNELEKKRVFDADAILQGMFYKHKAIAGKPFDEIIAIIRRWILQDVGYNTDGTVKPCLVIYDYFKIMTQDSMDGMQEYQALGFQISKLSDFCKLYQFPVLAFVQVNRDGVTKETSDIISGSDRLLWLCHSMSVWKRKTKEEIENDSDNGNMKLIPLEARFGASLDEGDYIHFTMDGEKSMLSEGKTFKETKREQLDRLNAEKEDVEL